MPRPDPSIAPDGTRYEDFRTGLTFADVRSMMWVGSDDPAHWRHKRRGGVLGYWHELKLQLWTIYCNQCTPARKDETNDHD